MSSTNTPEKMSPADPGASCGDGTCGCCEGTSVQTPAEITNRPGLAAINYRVGTHSQFKRSMLARLSDSARPALLDLRTRDDDDFTVALIDAWAVVADVLTFYQERIANESYLRTATERVSVLELARIVGYEPARGVAAGTWLAFTVQTAPGTPGSAIVRTGVQVKSVPGQDEKPQTFETVEEIEVRREWNALAPRLTALRYPAQGDAHVYLQGTATNLKEGDALLFVGGEREGNTNSNVWDFLRVKTVVADFDAGRTLVTLDRGLGTRTPNTAPARSKVYAMRLRASFFGFNAPDWRLLSDIIKTNYLGIATGTTLTTEQKREWPNFNIYTPPTTDSADGPVDLDAVYQQIKAASWVVLSAPEGVEVYGVTSAVEAARADFGLSSKTTRLRLSGKNLSTFKNRVRTTVVFAQSEELTLAETPLPEPVWGDLIELGVAVEGLAAGKRLMVTGKPLSATLRLAGNTRGLDLTLASDPERTVELSADEELTILSAPTSVGAGQQQWHLLTSDDHEGYLTGAADDFIYGPPPGAALPNNKHLVILSGTDLETTSEVATLESTNAADGEHTKLILSEPLQNFYERATVVIAANVAQATHGESIGEVLGGGDAARTNQSFKLRHAPLTYVSAQTETGAASTLKVRVNDLLWQEVPTLYGRGPGERVYVTKMHEDDSVTVHFGDGRNGARPPTGQENVTATYRKGLGREGLVREGQLSLLMTRPLGVKSVTNPMPATGGEDPESEESIRDAAPLTVLTLGRVVSLRDYEDFARTFAGLDKAHAVWTWQAGARGVYITVAGADGAKVPEGSDLQTNLVGALLSAGAPGVHVKVGSFSSPYFRLAATVLVDPAYIPENVAAAVEAALRARFSFEARSFGQPVALSEVVAVMQNVEGVVAVDVQRLHRDDDRGALLNTVVTAALPSPGTGVARVRPAELLTLHPDPLGDALTMEVAP
ncbi:MAG TPA: putative baseplate assembly protein [Pyrinomonadaceae bacterium]